MERSRQPSPPRGVSCVYCRCSWGAGFAPLIVADLPVLFTAFSDVSRDAFGGHDFSGRFDGHGMALARRWSGIRIAITKPSLKAFSLRRRPRTISRQSFLILHRVHASLSEIILASVANVTRTTPPGRGNFSHIQEN
jgi:hypothetical protein